MTTKFKFLTTALVAAVLFTSCTKEENPPQQGGEGEETYAVLTLSDLKTRTEGIPVDGVGDEDKVTQIEVYIFNADGSRDKHETTEGYFNAPEPKKNKLYTIPVMSGNKIFLAAVNANLGALANKTLTEVRNTVLALELDHTASTPVSPRAIPTAGIPMAGQSAAIYINADTNDTEVIIPVSRNFSMFKPLDATKVEVKIPAKDLETLFGTAVKAEDITFTMNKYYIVNGMKESYAFLNYNDTNEELKDWSNWQLTSRFASVYNNNQPTSVYSGKDASDNLWITRDATTQVFAYESAPSLTTTAEGIYGYDRKTVYAIILEGTLKHSETGIKDVTRYWRLNIAKKYDYKIFRNVQYTIKLESVSTKGYETPKDAEEDEDEGKIIPKEGEASVQAKVTITPWRSIDIGEGV